MDSRAGARRAPVVPGPPAGRGADRPGAQHLAGGIGGTGQPAAGGSLRRWLGRTLLGLLVGAALAGGAAPVGAAPRPAPAPDLVAFARAFNAAWNAHDVEGVVALFAPDATIRQTRARGAGLADTPVTAPVVEDVYGAGPRSLADADAVDPGAWAQGEVLWAAGTPRLRAWLPALFAAGHRVEASAYRTDGDVVTWRFRAFADPYQGVAGVEPVAGAASLVVRAGRAVSLGFETEGEAIDRRARQFDAALSARLTAAWAARQLPTSAGPRTDPRGPAPAPAAPARGPAAPTGPEPRLLLGLGGAAALAGLLARRRERGRGPRRPA